MLSVFAKPSRSGFCRVRCKTAARRIPNARYGRGAIARLSKAHGPAQSAMDTQTNAARVRRAEKARRLVLNLSYVFDHGAAVRKPLRTLGLAPVVRVDRMRRGRRLRSVSRGFRGDGIATVPLRLEAIGLDFSRIRLGCVHLNVCRSGRSWRRCLLISLPACIVEPEIVLRVLI